jgi:hypothetical protein
VFFEYFLVLIADFNKGFKAIGYKCGAKYEQFLGAFFAPFFYDLIGERSEPFFV